MDRSDGGAMAGSVRQRGNDSWQLRVHAGRDPATGRKRYVERTFRGNKRDASKALAAMVAEVDQRPVGSHGKGLFGFQRGATASGGPPELGEGAPGLWCEPTSQKHLRPCPP
jgi:hypothetical protein